MANNKIIFKRTISLKGCSPGVAIPKEMVDFIGTKLGQKVQLIAEEYEGKPCIIIINNDTETVTE